MQWDIFCRVIDNFGDVGVCWRLCADLAARGEKVRLWVDDASALAWMAPGATGGNWPGVQVLGWERSKAAAVVAALPASEVWVEGFGCEIAPEFIAACAGTAWANGRNDLEQPVWINLEYLSAEGYVERAHGLPSPIQQGPARGWTRHFFYPGFTEHSGGLLREPDLLERMDHFDAPQWLAQYGIVRQPRECLVALFCYEPPALERLLNQLACAGEPVRLLATHGRAAAAVRTAMAEENSRNPAWNAGSLLSISYLPALPQREFDHLLWACDLNFVRGEDSLVRALWAGKALVWQIYPQDDAAHHAKLGAFLDALHASASLRQVHAQWNALPGTAADAPLPLAERYAWEQTVKAARQSLLAMDDLTTRLLEFVQKKR